MARPSADPSIPPPLRALGGWPNADWFDSAILDAGEVVGISLPAFAGGRKQTFELDERSARQPTPKKRAPKPPPRQGTPAGITQILDDVGVSRAASFRRPRFFFGAAPTLFFAEIPTAHLKARAADTLRRNLIANAMRGCVLSSQSHAVITMFWPSQESEITAFIRAAAPPHSLHAQFDKAEDAARETALSRRAGTTARSTPPPAASRTPPRADRAERERLLAELDGLRAKVVELQGKHSLAAAMETLGLDDARLKAMLLLLHPDRHNNSPAANEAAKWVNGLREILRGNAR